MELDANGMHMQYETMPETKMHEAQRYQNYRGFCERLHIQPASREIWRKTVESIGEKVIS
jgi:hypothetical protein